MTARWLWLTLLITGCARTVPTPQPAHISAELVQRQTLAHDTAKPAREAINSSLRLQQVAAATNATLQQQAWEARVFAASPNVTANVTTMINPMDSKGRIMEQQIFTYYDRGRLRYATNFFDSLK